ncbi:DUF5946 family protein [Streptosporangium lutulentum]
MSRCARGRRQLERVPMTTTTCPGCGLVAPATGGPLPDERRASAECWERYGELLARSYTIAEYRHVHQLIVDAYIAQHSGDSSRRGSRAWRCA